jgi:hypothetical protein
VGQGGAAVKTNHRDSTRKRRDRHGFSPNSPLKQEASANRRRLEAQVCGDVKAGHVEPEDAGSRGVEPVELGLAACGAWRFLSRIDIATVARLNMAP